MPSVSESNTTTRRAFLQGAAAAAVAAPYLIPSSALGLADAPPPSERISLGIIGVNGMGQGNLANCASQKDVVVTGVCDVWKARRDQVLARHKDAKGHADFRELLARKDVDAVIIATPPHWHALIAIMAVEAGKDIYLQKPMTLHPDETLAVRKGGEKARAHQARSAPDPRQRNYRRVVEWIRSGKLVPVRRRPHLQRHEPGPEASAAPRHPPCRTVWTGDVLGPRAKRPYNALLRSTAIPTALLDYRTAGPRMAPTSSTCPSGRSTWGVRCSTSSLAAATSSRTTATPPTPRRSFGSTRIRP